jgi:hypothetical protein
MVAELSLKFELVVKNTSYSISIDRYHILSMIRTTVVRKEILFLKRNPYYVNVPIG